MGIFDDNTQNTKIGKALFDDHNKTRQTVHKDLFCHAPFLRKLNMLSVYCQKMAAFTPIEFIQSAKVALSYSEEQIAALIKKGF